MDPLASPPEIITLVDAETSISKQLVNPGQIYSYKGLRFYYNSDDNKLSPTSALPRASLVYAYFLTSLMFEENYINSPTGNRNTIVYVHMFKVVTRNDVNSILENGLDVLAEKKGATAQREAMKIADKGKQFLSNYSSAAFYMDVIDDPVMLHFKIPVDKYIFGTYGPTEWYVTENIESRYINRVTEVKHEDLGLIPIYEREPALSRGRITTHYHVLQNSLEPLPNVEGGRRMKFAKEGLINSSKLKMTIKPKQATQSPQQSKKKVIDDQTKQKMVIKPKQATQSPQPSKKSNR
jgi:hypothetical protein